jgi:hypothetical protein
MMTFLYLDTPLFLILTEYTHAHIRMIVVIMMIIAHDIHSTCLEEDKDPSKVVEFEFNNK